jgi:hypothetical protein
LRPRARARSFIVASFCASLIEEVVGLREKSIRKIVPMG